MVTPICGHGQRTSAAGIPVSRYGLGWIRTTDLTLIRCPQDRVNPGKKPSKFNQDCTICHSCRKVLSGSAGLKWPEDGIKWQVFGRNSALLPARERLVDSVEPVRSVELRFRIFEHRIFSLDGVGFGHQDLGGLATDIRLSR